jgi:hypothetical protein
VINWEIIAFVLSLVFSCSTSQVGPAGPYGLLGHGYPFRCGTSFEEMTRMLFIGLLLLGATGAFTALAIAGNLSGGPEYTVTVLGHEIATMNTLAVFSSGLALALLFCLALAMMVTGATHRRRRPRTYGSGGTTHLDELMGPDTRA